MSKLRAAIAGLGQVGMLFDADAKRSGVWTHFTAYERLHEEFDLVAACDTSQERLDAAQKRRPQLHCYRNLDELLSRESIDVLSICTPSDLHLEQLGAACERVRAVICEKPLGGSFAQARQVVEAYQQAGKILAVNFYKRYDGVIPAVMKIAGRKALGTLTRISARYSGPLDAVGSHALDLLDYFAGPATLKCVLADGAEAGTAVMRSDRVPQIVLERTGRREDLIFELDIIGTEGRIQVLDNCDRAIMSTFKDSLRYSGYRELVRRRFPAYRAQERFLPLFLEVARAVNKKGKGAILSTGATALRTQSLLEEINLCLTQ